MGATFNLRVVELPVAAHHALERGFGTATRDLEKIVPTRMRSAREKETPVYLQGHEREGYEHGSRSMHRPHGTLQKCNIIADPYAPHHRFVPTYSSLDVFSVRHTSSCGWALVC